MSELEHQSALSRRGFLVGLAGAAVTFGFAPGEGTAEESGSSPFEPTIWYSLDRDGIVTVNIIRAEMGQHIGTAIARILADELEVDWSNVRISAVDTDPKWGVMSTGGSKSVWLDFPIYSRAGAAGRIALIEAGAKLLGVSPSQCVARQGAVFAADRSISYGEIVRRGRPARKFTPDELAKLPIKPRLGAASHREKDRCARYPGEDQRHDALRHRCGRRRHGLCPAEDSSDTLRLDGPRGRRFRGEAGQGISHEPRARGPLQSRCPVGSSCARRLIRQRSAPLTSSRSIGSRVMLPRCRSRTSSITAQSRSLHRAAERSVVDDPGVDSAFRAAASTLERTYTTGSVLHAQLEPVNALAFEKDGRFEIHTGNQGQSLILPVLAQALGLPQERIVLRTYPIGGAFGRRLNGDYAVPAALAAKALGKPVKLVLTRPDDMRFDSFRSPSIQTLRLAFDAQGKVTAMEHHASAGWPTAVMCRQRPCRRHPMETHSIHSPSTAPTTGTAWARSASARSRTTLPTRVSPWLSAIGRARLDQLGGRDLHG